MNIKPFIPVVLTTEKKIGDKDVSSNLSSGEKISPDLAFDYDAIAKFNAHASGNYSVNLFNDVGDHKDESGKEDKTAKYWPELANLYKTGGLLAYTLGGKLKAAASGTALEKFSLGIDAEQSLIIKSYRYHGNDIRIKNGYDTDLESFRVIFNPEDVCKNLQINEALALQAAGKIEVSAEVKLSDVISGTASMVSGILNLNGKFKFKAETAVSLKFGAQIEDDFQISIIRLAADKFRVIIGKIINRSTELKASAGITAGIEKTDDVDKLVDQMFESIDENVFKKVNGFIKGAGLKQEHLELAQQAGTLLGFDKILSPEDFKTKYEEKKKTAKDQIINIATTKVEVGIAYEYKSISNTEALFNGEFSSKGIAENYSRIIRLKIKELTSLKQDADFKLVSYFRRDTKQLNTSFGINLAFGKFKLGAQTQKDFKETTELFQSEERKLKVTAYSRDIKKTFSGGVVSNDDYALHFSADMKTFVKEPAELTAEKFDFEFGLSLDITDRKISKKELYDAVDWALTWDIIRQEQFQDVVDSIEKKVLAVDNNIVKYKLFLSVAENQSGNSTLFDLLLPKIANASNVTIASALAASLPYAEFVGNPASPKIRQDISLRRQRYTSFWLKYLQEWYKDQRENSTDDFGAAMGEELRKLFEAQGLTDLANFESNPKQYPKYMSATIQNILAFDFVSRDVQLIRNGFGILNDAVNKRTHYSKAFEQFNQQIKKVAFQKDFNLRFTGRLLLDLADEIHIKEQINRGLSITYQENNEEKVFVVA
jgi:hypothetical protein